jgi:hypothetical protein
MVFAGAPGGQLSRFRLAKAGGVWEVDCRFHPHLLLLQRV